jgi:hypothetical protein
MSGAIDWAAISTEDMLTSLRAAPKVSGPWVRACGRDSWIRTRTWPEPTWPMAAFVHRSGLDGWWWSTHGAEEVRGHAATADEARQCADAALLASGWRIT